MRTWGGEAELREGHCGGVRQSQWGMSVLAPERGAARNQAQGLEKGFLGESAP